MNAAWRQFARNLAFVVGAAAVLLPMGLNAQMGMDPNANPANPLNSGMSEPPAPGPESPGSLQPQTMRDSLGAPGDTGQQMMDKQFLVKAAEGGVAEVQMGKLATQKGSPEVKQFGERMVDDHTNLNREIGEMADQIGVMLPKKMNKDDQAEYDRLNALSGDAFDREYLTYIIKDHRKDMRQYSIEARAASNQSLQTELIRQTGVIREHLQVLTKLAEEKGVPMPPRPPRPMGPPPGL